MSDKKLNLKIRDTQSVLFEGMVDRITTLNEVGPFDVYPMHANLISILRNQLLVYNDHKMIKEIKFEQAVLKVKQDKAQVFLGLEGFLLEEEKIAGGKKKTEEKKQ